MDFDVSEVCFFRLVCLLRRMLMLALSHCLSHVSLLLGPKLGYKVHWPRSLGSEIHWPPSCVDKTQVRKVVLFLYDYDDNLRDVPTRPERMHRHSNIPIQVSRNKSRRPLLSQLLQLCQCRNLSSLPTILSIASSTSRPSRQQVRVKVATSNPNPTSSPSTHQDVDFLLE